MPRPRAAASSRARPTREEREARAEQRAQQHRADLERDPLGVARQVCLSLLELGPRTRAELAAALARREVPEEAAQEVLSRFAEVGMIDDALFSRMWVSSRHRGRGLAGRALSSELRRKGVDEDVVRDAVAELEPEVELATARELVRRRVPATRGLSADARVRRLAGLLARKGYPAGLAFRVVREELAAEGTEVPEVDLDDDGPAGP